MRYILVFEEIFETHRSAKSYNALRSNSENCFVVKRNHAFRDVYVYATFLQQQDEFICQQFFFLSFVLPLFILVIFVYSLMYIFFCLVELTTYGAITRLRADC